MKYTFWNYLKDNPSLFAIWPLVILIGVSAYIEGAPLMAEFMSAVMVISIWASIVDFKDKSKQINK